MQKRKLDEFWRGVSLEQVGKTHRDKEPFLFFTDYGAATAISERNGHLALVEMTRMR